MFLPRTADGYSTLARDTLLPGEVLENDERRGWGVSLRCAPGRASRAVGNETTVANGAEPPARQASPRT
jgi:hypothetical protein